MSTTPRRMDPEQQRQHIAAQLRRISFEMPPLPDSPRRRRNEAHVRATVEAHLAWTSLEQCLHEKGCIDSKTVHATALGLEAGERRLIEMLVVPAAPIETKPAARERRHDDVKPDGVPSGTQG